MSDEAFLHRWSRLKRAAAHPPSASEAVDIPSALQGAKPPAAVAATKPPLPEHAAVPGPTMADVALLGADADYAPFMVKTVDRTVQRMALKKLFADPCFNVMDRLDIYIDDYNRASPVSAAMLDGLQHARELLARGLELEATGKQLAQAAPFPPPDETKA
ncbi:DUF3306 domain-containing protein [Massilia sp. TSP1-1-2]|uniref:DUF3306 domain-containing protein n=1 Tax=unclassified Massilia TaxID=2609279 RepID=UPI003CF2622B